MCVRCVPAVARGFFFFIPSFLRAKKIFRLVINISTSEIACPFLFPPFRARMCSAWRYYYLDASFRHCCTPTHTHTLTRASSSPPLRAWVFSSSTYKWGLRHLRLPLLLPAPSRLDAPSRSRHRARLCPWLCSWLRRLAHQSGERHIDPPSTRRPPWRPRS